MRDIDLSKIDRLPYAQHWGVFLTYPIPIPAPTLVSISSYSTHNMQP